MKNDLSFYDHPLTCDCCGAEVEPEDIELEPRSETYTNDAGETVTIPYSAAICPECGRVLCERELGYNLAKFMRMYMEEHKNDEQ